MTARSLASHTAAWLSALPRSTAVVSLADGYAGYVETPAAIAADRGEAKTTYYGPDLAKRLGDAARAAAEATAARERK